MSLIPRVNLRMMKMTNKLNIHEPFYTEFCESLVLSPPTLPPSLTFSPTLTLTFTTLAALAIASLVGSAAGLHCESRGFPTSLPPKLSGKRKNLVVAFTLALSIGCCVSATIFHLCILRLENILSGI